LFYALEQLVTRPFAFMLVKAPEEPNTCSGWRRNSYAARTAAPLYGVRYQVNGGTSRSPGATAEDNFASVAPVEAADWVEAEQLLAACASLTVKSRSARSGPSRQRRRIDSLTPRLLAQPLLWMRLKNMVTRQRFDWLSIR
jgi:Lon-like ATP-dependent protease